MKLSLNKFILLTAMFGVSITAFAFPDITGKWRCSGYDPYLKQNFSVSGDIKKSGETYALVNWKNDATGEPRSGTGVQYEKIDNTFAAVFWSDNDSSQVGFALSKVHSADKMVGTWTIKNGTMVAEETCERIDSKVN
jgi:hypothetical protein